MSNALTRTGTCKYCNQVRGVAGSGRCTEDELNKIASEECDCTGAKLAREKARRTEKANNNIELAFHENHEETEVLLKAAVPILLNYDITSITIDTGKGVKGTVKMTSKGSLKVSKTATKKVEYDE